MREHGDFGLGHVEFELCVQNTGAPSWQLEIQHSGPVACPIGCLSGQFQVPGKA